jgi:uncharacterized protein (TIGR03790 family)
MLMLLFPLLLAAPAAQGFDPDPEGLARRVLVLYNANWPDENGDGVGDSEEVARFYAAKRGIPLANLVALNCSPTSYYYSGQTGWEAFWDEVVIPVRDHIDLVVGNRVGVGGLVFCYGMPYQINPPGWGRRGLDTTMIGLWALGSRSSPAYSAYGSFNSYHDPAPTIGNDKERFDPANRNFGGEPSYLCGRLDGLDAEHAKELVEYALYGDAYISPQPGYHQGFVYADTRYGAYTWADLAGYPFGHATYTNADKDMAYGRQWLDQPGFVLRWEPYSTEIGEAGAKYEDGSSAETAPQALFYEGWYNYNKYQDVWEWLVGSIACDLNSNSIARIRDLDPGTFLGESFQLGLAAGVGAIAEPYLNGHPFPEVFQHYLLVKGYTFGEAARISDPKLLWTNLYVGDILYQPMRVGKVALLDTQAPPPSVVTEGPGALAGERDFATRLNTFGMLPDVGRMQIEYGPTPVFGQTIYADQDRPRLYHTSTMTGLRTDQLVHYRADYTDPADNVGLGHEYILHTALDTMPVIARVETESLSLPVGSAFEIELVYGSQAGADTLTVTTATVTSAVMGWAQYDLASRLPMLNPTYFQSAQGKLQSARLTVPGILPAGSYLIEVTATSPAGSDSDSITIDLY